MLASPRRNPFETRSVQRWNSSDRNKDGVPNRDQFLGRVTRKQFSEGEHLLSTGLDDLAADDKDIRDSRPQKSTGQLGRQDTARHGRRSEAAGRIDQTGHDACVEVAAVLTKFDPPREAKLNLTFARLIDLEPKPSVERRLA